MTGHVVDYGRQTLIMDPLKSRDAKVTVFGCGTVGSNAAVECAKLGIGRFSLYDFDMVEAHNIPSQRFSKTDIGRQKVDALKEQINAVSDIGVVSVFNTRVDGPVLVGDGIVILAVDNMVGRRLVYDILKTQVGVDKIIDFRMGGNVLQCYAFDPGDERYEHSLFAEEDAVEAPCGGRTVSYTGALAGCLAANYTRKVLSGGVVPYMTQFDLEAMDMVVV